MCILALLVAAAAMPPNSMGTARHHARTNAHPAAFNAWLPKWMGQPWGSMFKDPARYPDTTSYSGQDLEDKYAHENFFHEMAGGTYLEMGALEGKLTPCSSTEPWAGRAS